MPILKFNSTQKDNAFFTEARKEVAAYFKEGKLSAQANAEMITKCIFWILSWVVSWYAVILFKDNFIIAFSIGIIHMFTHIMIAFNIMHDANHDAIFKSKKANYIISHFIELLGCNRKLWLLSHNQEHHTFINIHKEDSNIEGYKLLRLTPEEKWLRHHKYQWLYAPFLYALVTINYATFKDVKMIFKYAKQSKLELNFAFISEFILFKLLYYIYLFIIPIFVFGVSFKLILLFWLAGHVINGLFLTLIFVTGHLTENTSYPKVSNDSINSNWAVHVVNTTGDYSINSNLEWLVGGINLHVAHHLFPGICHVHYKAISSIIKNTAHKHGLTYREIPKFRTALKSHFVLLKELGRPEYN